MYALNQSGSHLLVIQLSHLAIAIKCQAPITEYSIGPTVHLNLRIYDGIRSNWFAALDLLDKAKA